MNQPLNRTTAKLPPNPFPNKVLQFGGGNFLRAFVNWMIDVLNEGANFQANTIIVKPTERGDYSALRQQDGLFHVLLEGVKGDQHIIENKLIKNVSQIIHAYHQWDDFIASAKSLDIRFIISNTTEAGIKFSEPVRRPDGSDKKTTPPKEFPAKLTIWLHERYQHFNGNANKGCIFLPCELIEDNGDALKDCILKYAELFNYDIAFAKWIDEHNIFCNTLVDRIVSGYPTEKASSIEEKLGFQDALLAAGEYYHSWIIQAPEQVKSELPFHKTNLNVKFVDDLSTHREIKVRLLNGAHTSMVPVGYLAGLETVREGIEDLLVGTYVRELLSEEVIPSLDLAKAELQSFADDVIDRFRNPSIRHLLISIALNSTSKYVTRLLPSLKAYQTKTGQLPKRICFALTALIKLYQGEMNGQVIPLKDNADSIAFIQSEWQKYLNESQSLNNLVEHILSNTDIWGEPLNSIEGLTELVESYLSQINKHGIRNALVALTTDV